MKIALLVDDDPENRCVIRLVLESEGWLVQEASDGESALAMASESKPDLILSDILMPLMDGYSFCSAVRREPLLSGVKFIFLTGTFCEDQDIELAKSIGTDAFLTKPIESMALIEKINEVMDKPTASGQPNSWKESEKSVVAAYNHSLIRKLEDKTREFQELNRQLSEAEKKRREYQSEREMFFYHASDLLFVGNRDGFIVDVNEACLNLFGYEREDLLLKPIIDLVHIDDREFTEKKLKELYEGRHVSRLLNRCYACDGSWHWIEWRGSLGSGEHFYVCGRDVSDNMAADYEKSLLYTAVMAVPFAVVVTDPRGKIELVNPAFQKMTGYTSGDIVGKTTQMLKSGEHDDAFYDELWKTILSGKSWTGEIVNRRKNGSFYTERMTITPVVTHSREINHFIAIKEDITLEKKQEQRNLRSQRMENIGLLAGGIAHDLNNVLAPIMMALDILKLDVVTDENKGLIDQMQANCRRGADIISQVLTFARGLDGKHIELQIRHLMKDIIKMATETFPKNIEIKNHVSSDLWPVSGDSTQLQQVLLNLAVNARDAMSEGGVMEFAAENIENPGIRENLNLSISPGRYVHLSVTDSGMGINKEDQERVFEPFFTTKAEGKGTGLGLSTVLGIIKNHSGLIELKSEIGMGTRFDIYLPVSEKEVQDEKSNQVKLHAGGRGETLLIVDDEEAILLVTRSILEVNGYRVLCAKNGVEALRVLSEKGDKIKGVITDVMMPVMGGVELVVGIKEFYPDLKIIGSSGYTGDGDKNKAEDLKRLGVPFILRKPYSLSELLSAISKELLGQN